MNDDMISPSSCCSSESSSPYRRSRFHGQTRRAALERRFGKHFHDEKKEEHDVSPRTALRKTTTGASAEGEYANDATVTTVASTTMQEDEHDHENQRHYHGYVALHERITMDRLTTIDDDGVDDDEGGNMPLFRRHGDDNAGAKYYRVVYRGVVSLVTAPGNGGSASAATRTGRYLSFGEVFASHQQVKVPVDRKLRPSLDPRRTAADHYHHAVEKSLQALSINGGGSEPPPGLPLGITQECLAIRVDEVLTGGYALDAGEEPPPDGATDDPTPLKSNYSSQFRYLPMLNSCSPTSSSCSPPDHEDDEPGYVFSMRGATPILEQLDSTPQHEHGKFVYKIMSLTPLPILTGPCLDAPKTKAMVLPGTTHEVCTRLCVDPDGDGVWYLKLSHRRGWIADRKMVRSRNGGRAPVTQSLPVIQEVTGGGSTDLGMMMMANAGGGATIGSSFDDGSVSLSSVAASSVTTPSAAARRRHRPPRRRREALKEKVDKMLPRHVSSTTSTAGAPAASPLVAKTPTKSSTSRSCLNDSTLTPCSNVSILSDDSSVEHSTSLRHAYPTSPDNSFGGASSRVLQAPTSPDASFSTRDHIIPLPQPVPMAPPPVCFYLVRVTAPRGMKILDAPHFQVNSLINSHRRPDNAPNGINAPVGSSSSTHQSIFQTMSGRSATTTAGPQSNQSRTPAVYDAVAKCRVLPRGVLFEASKRAEGSSGTYSQGAGLIKLADNSGWAVVPRKSELDQQYKQYHGGVAANVREGEALRGYLEVGNAKIETLSDVSSFGLAVAPSTATYWLRVSKSSGIAVVCQPPVADTAAAGSSEDSSSPTSSRGSSTVDGTAQRQQSLMVPAKSSESDVASSIASSFLDTMMFRSTPKKKEPERTDARPAAKPVPPSTSSSQLMCGVCVEVENWDDAPGHGAVEYVRLRGGQGWIPIVLNNRACVSQVHPPDYRFGSFWFRVQAPRGVKVRLGPSRRAPSIKSEVNDRHFRFECGEFLRASEIITIFSDDGEASECFAKLYRNRHARLHTGEEKMRSLSSLTTSAEWVQVYGGSELHLEECSEAPRIERHKDGWRYNAIPDQGVVVRVGPSFAAERTGQILLGGESVMVNERVTPFGDKITWLRIKDHKGGWVHDVDDQNKDVMLAHSLRHRRKALSRASQPAGAQEAQAYDTIMARLFPKDTGGGVGLSGGNTARSRSVLQKPP